MLDFKYLFIFYSFLVSAFSYSQTSPTSFSSELPFLGPDDFGNREFGIYHVNSQELFSGLGLKRANVLYSEELALFNLSDFEKLKLKLKYSFNEVKKLGNKLPKTLVFKIERGVGDFSEKEKKELKKLCKAYNIKLKIEYPKINWQKRLNNYKKRLRTKYPKNFRKLDNLVDKLYLIAKNIDNKIYKKIYGKKFHQTPTKQEVIGGFSKMAVTLVGMSYLLPTTKGIYPNSWVFWAIATVNIVTEMSIAIYGKSYMNVLNNNWISRKTKFGVGIVATGLGYLLFLPYRFLQEMGGYVTEGSTEFTYTYAIMATIGFMSSFLSLGVEKLIQKKWVRRSVGVNLIQAVDSFMGIEGILATGVDGNSPKSTLYTWLVFGIHNGTKIMTTLMGLLFPHRAIKSKFIVMPSNRRNSSQLPPEKDFFKSYDEFYKYLMDENIDQDKKIRFLEYINYFLTDKKEHQVIDDNLSYRSMIDNIIKASYKALKTTKDNNYRDALSEIIEKYPLEYKSPLDKLRNIVSTDKYSHTEIEKVLNQFVINGCY